MLTKWNSQWRRGHDEAFEEFCLNVHTERMTAIGLMSGTSMDGVDAALIETDGDAVFGFGESLSLPYPETFREKLRALLGTDPIGDPAAPEVSRELESHHVEAVAKLLAAAGLRAGDVGVVGFHGHTVLHEPDRGVTRQIGDAQLLAEALGIQVVGNFRAADVAAGGEGAPLAPVYHAALARDVERPVAVLNIGGVANLTWISPDGGVAAFDTGPGNALIDDWMRARTGAEMDRGGRLAHQGRIDESALAELLDDPYFDRPFPKSLDRNAFSSAPVENLDTADGAATLSAFTAAAVERAEHILPAPPLRWLVCGGGRRNLAIMSALRERLEGAVEPVEAVGWQGDALEAQAFAYLAVRSLGGLPLSYPQTTGVGRPQSGGVCYTP